MYRCEECGEIFEEPRKYEERDVGYEALLCPYCDCDTIEEVRECKYCGEYKSYLDIDGYCNDCIGNTRRKFNLFLRSRFEEEELQILKTEFNVEEIE